MIFSSIEFLFFFLPIFLIIYYIVPFKAKNVILLLASLLFYSWGEPIYVALMILSSVFGYVFAILINSTRKHSVKCFLVVLSTLINIGILGFFKYTDFLIDILNSFGADFEHLDIALPIGISFFTFQIMSYVFDVYRGNQKVEKNLLVLMTYVSMFPQLIAGPIVRFQTVAEQMRKREISLRFYIQGSERFLIGLFKKVLIANNIGILWESIKAYDISTLSLSSAWLGAIAFSLQLYFDFSGYADMAIGMGKMLGFDYNENFNYPYVSKSITEFWRRWHMSLSTWFRDYVYIPMGGNRCSVARHILNIMTVWALTGLWHGAAWNFVIWGIYYGLLLVCEKYIWGNAIAKLPSFLQHIYAIVIVVIGFTVFAIDDFNTLISYLRVMLLNSNNILCDNFFMFNIKDYAVILLAGILLSMPLYPKVKYKILKHNIVAFVLFTALFVVCVAYIVNSGYNPFLYFRF